MKNNKGFTLIELLAVMVILAIIALIATPVVMNVIKNARQAAAVDSTYGIVKAAEAYYANEMLVNGGNFTAVSAKAIETVTGTNSAKIEYKGTKAKAATGTIAITTDGEITIVDIEINGFKCNYDSKTTATASCETA